MGVVLDTSVLVAAERGDLDMPALLARLGQDPVAIAAITAAELLYGVEHAGHAARRARRGAFVKKQLEDKNRINDQLEQSRVGPVKVLDYVSQRLDPLKLWLVRVGVNGPDIDLEGRALTNDDVVEFVNNLRRTDYFTNINLHESRAAVESQMSVYQFKLGFRLKG